MSDYYSMKPTYNTILCSENLTAFLPLTAVKSAKLTLTAKSLTAVKINTPTRYSCLKTGDTSDLKPVLDSPIIWLKILFMLLGQNLNSSIPVGQKVRGDANDKEKKLL